MTEQSQSDSLATVMAALARHEHAPDSLAQHYRVPQFAADPDAGTGWVDVGNPYAFYRRFLRELTDGSMAGTTQLPDSKLPGFADPGQRLDENDVIYLSFIRTGAAVDGRIGSVLSQLLLLPHLRRLGVTVLLTLPTGRIGMANRKGLRGSPFAVADPFAMDPSLADPLLPEVDATTQYRALVQACATIGIRCGSIVPVATLALDSPLLRHFPEITYWWDSAPGTALLAGSGSDPLAGSPDIVASISTDQSSRFHRPPPTSTVAPVDERGARLWRSADGLTPASACPDVLADEAGTYSWADVAGLRFNDQHVPDFASASASTAANRSVQIVALTLAWRAAVLGEKVFWVDVAARVPAAALNLARQLIHTWDEQSEQLCALLSATTPTAPSELADRLDSLVSAATGAPSTQREVTFIAEELYSFRSLSVAHDAVVGPWIFCVAPFTHDLPTLRASAVHHLQLLADMLPIRDTDGAGRRSLYLTGLGNHDTAPPDPAVAAGLLTLSWLLPGGIPLLFTGQEHGTTLVVNKEFGFNTTPELRAWRSTLGDEVIALFNDVPMPWDALNPTHDLTDLICALLRLRTRIAPLCMDRLTRADDPAGFVVGYHRTDPDERHRLTVCFNTDPYSPQLEPVPSGAKLLLATDQTGTREFEIAPLAGRIYATPALFDLLQPVRG